MREGEWYTNGGSCLAGPNAKWIQEPVLGGEKLFIHDIDLNDVRTPLHYETRFYRKKRKFSLIRFAGTVC